MKRYLLDSNVVSEFRKAKPHGAVLQWMSALSSEQVFISAVTIGELQVGVELTRRQNPTRAAELERWIEELILSRTISEMDHVCFREWARLIQGKSQDLFADAMIAATARVHGFVVATRNEDDFAHFRVEIVNPFRTG